VLVSVVVSSLWRILSVCKTAWPVILRRFLAKNPSQFHVQLIALMSLSDRLQNFYGFSAFVHSEIASAHLQCGRNIVWVMFEVLPGRFDNLRPSFIGDVKLCQDFPWHCGCGRNLKHSLHECFIVALKWAQPGNSQNPFVKLYKYGFLGP